MRAIIAVIAVTLALAVGFDLALAAARTPGETELLLKKKKRAAEKKLASRRDCGSFLKCLFGGSDSRRRTSRDLTLSDRRTGKMVAWNEASYKPGSIVVRTPERALYHVLGGGKARRYKVGVGREGFQWSGSSRIVGKQEWPGWRPPEEMIEREAAKGIDLPDYMEGGPRNPLGARALYIGGTLFRIHGTNDFASIGGAVSSGCIRMMNADVIELYDRIEVGARVYVYQ